MTNCGQCGNGCPPTAKFCGECGSRLEWSCVKCAAPNAADNRFCESCGTSRDPQFPVLAPVPVEGVSSPASVARADGERRYLTVMFCDLVGSTTLSGDLDPEDMQRVVLGFQQACTSAIERNGGYVAHYMGDGILAYFGYPVATEHAAANAARAGLAIVENVKHISPDMPSISVRVGIHAGLAVIADMGAGQSQQVRDVIGETPNVAARVQSMAMPGTVLMSGDAHRLCEGFIVSRSIGHRELKGVARSIELFEVMADTGASSRMDVAHARHTLTPLLGRQREIDVLARAWRRSQRGDGQVVWISGDPGIGKSRLIRELSHQVRADDGIEIELRCSQFHQSSSLYSSTEQFRRYVLAVSTELSLRAIERLGDDSGTPRGLVVPVVADLLGVPFGPPYQRVAGSADFVRKHTLDVIARIIEDRARRQPVLLVIEDIQWIDATSAEMVERFIGPEQSRDLAVIVTHRSDFQPTRPAVASHHQYIHLDRLDQEEVLAFVAAVAGDRAVDSRRLAQIVARTEGVPLFIEELTQLVLDDIDGASDSVPATLRDSLTARIDLLGPEVDLLRTLAVVGREAPDGLLHEVSQLDRQTFERYRDRLIEGGLVIRRGRGVHAVYGFKHALQHSVVYESMLRVTRRAVHARVASALEVRFVDRSVTEPEVSARHHELAGDLTSAVHYLGRAGARAIAISAHREALTHLQHARQLVAQLPDGRERDLEEISVLVQLGVPTTALLGYGSEETEEVYSSAERLCALVGEGAPVYAALYGLFRTRLLRGEYSNAQEISVRLMGLAAAEPGREALRVGAERAMGSVLLYQGRSHRESLDHLEGALAASHTERPGAYLGDLNDVVDPIVTCRAYAAWALWLLGEPKAARALSDEAVSSARRLAHPFTLGLALCFDTWLCQFERDIDAVERRADEAYRHSIDYGFPFWTGWANVLRAWVRAARGDVEGVDAMRAGIDEWQAQGSALGKSYFLGLVGEGEAMVGLWQDSATTLDGAIELAERVGEGFWLPELVRLRAEAAQGLGEAPAAVAALLDRAEHIATGQGAQSLLERIAQTAK